MNKYIILLIYAVFWSCLWGTPLTAQSFSDGVNRNIPGTEQGYFCENATLSSINVNLPGFIGENYDIQSVALEILHENPEDLNISLISPRGTILNLASKVGGSTDNAFAATTFTDMGANIELTAPPFNANFRAMGGSINDRFDGELITGQWTLEVCDLYGNNNSGVVSDFTISFLETSAPDPNPVYDINVSSTNFINVNLDEDCQHLLTFQQLIQGNLDQDGDGNLPPNEAFIIEVNDDNPCNGPIVDGCGTFDFWISMPPMEPEIQRGFMGCTGGQSILEFTSEPSPATQTADVTVTPDTVTLFTQATQFNTGTVQAGISYVFPRSGQVGFRLDVATNNLFDVAIISFDGTTTNVGGLFDSPDFIQSQPLDVEIGDRLQFTLRKATIGLGGSLGEATAKIFDFFFQPTVPNIPVTNFLPLGGFVTAIDATPVEFTLLPTSPDDLFSAQLADVLTTSIPASVSRSYQVRGNGEGGPNLVISGTLDPELRERILLGGGFPRVYDGCSDVEITVADQIISAGNCQDIVVRRIFAARETSGCTSNEGGDGVVTSSYEIVFQRPGLADVEPPMSVIEVDCENFTDGGNPEALPENFPALSTINGDLPLNQTIDNIGATFEDGPRINTCANTYKFVRTYTVVDWCDVDEVMTFNQLIKVGDFGAPMIIAPQQDLDFDGVVDQGPLRFSTNASGCTAFIDITAGVVIDDDCSEVTTLIAYIFRNGNLNGVPLGPFNAVDIARDVPVGDHILQYIANDICGNADTLNVDIMVSDFTAPVAICENGLNISLGGNGTAILEGVDVNRASYDECTEDEDLLYEIVRVMEDGTPIGPWSTEINLTCSDIGTLMVGLRVTDDGNMNGINEPGIDNSNICMAAVLVEDLGVPVCLPPSSFALNCADLDSNFPTDLEQALANDPDDISALLNATFGMANGIDNCPGAVISQTVEDNRNDCGVGLIVRTFGVQDAQGFNSFSNCRQTISIAGSFDYSVAFPADQDDMNCVEPDFNMATIMGGSCSMLTMTTRIDTFATNANACYLLRVTYEVIDLCEFGTTADPYTIPRDADGDGINGEAVILRITQGTSSASISDDVAVLDNDLSTANGYLDELDSSDGGLVNGGGPGGYGLDPSRGAFIYQQFITVIDDTAPMVDIDETDNVAEDMDGNCQADLEVQFSVADECSMEDISVIVDVDFFPNDQNNDGIITAAEFIPNQTVNVTDVTDIGEGDFRALLRDLPIGRHAVRVRASDNCGNTNPDIMVFDVADMTGPSITCIMGLTATLSATENGGGIASTTALTFVVDADNVNDCSGTVEYAVYRLSTATSPGFVPNRADNVLTVTCADLGMLPVRVYAFDPNNMATFCETTILVQANDPSICNPEPPDNTPRGLIAGNIMTPAGETMEGVEMNITAQLMGDFITYTSNAGTYIVEHLMEGDDFTIQPEYNPAIDLAQVSTGDLILISRHILGLQEFSGPFQYVAADVTNDRRINVLDMIAIRRVILGLTQEFGGTDSYRFISADHNFSSLPENWLENNLMEVYNVNDLAGQMLSADFTAIRMGDVSAATEAGNLIEPGSQRSNYALTVPVLPLQEAGIYEVPFYQPSDLLGFQTTVQLLAGLELIDIIYGTASEGDFNLNYVANGLIGISHVSVPVDNSPLFTLRVRAASDGQLQDLLQLNDRIVTSESYAREAGYPVTAGLILDFIEANNANSSHPSEGFELEQNYPNPFRQATRIDFTLPVATEVILTVHDLQGRLIYRQQTAGISGRNSIQVQREDLKNATGLLSYTVATSTATLTRKMLVSN